MGDQKRRLIGWRVRWFDATGGGLAYRQLTWRKASGRPLDVCESDARDAADFIGRADYASHVQIMRVFRRAQ